ncbi:MAG: hypothetical protein R3F49_22825 [Planctomycetota bacterium]
MTPRVVAVNVVAGQAAKSDQVFRIDPRSGKIVTIKGRVEQHGLERVVITRRDDKEGRYDTSEIVEVIFGDVPPAFTEARRYLARGDFESSVARFRVAAGDASARPVVQGRARLGAAEALMEWGATDPTRFREAAEEAERFISSFADDRNIPVARALLGRAQVLAGEGAKGAATLEALFKTGQAGTLGYPRTLTLQAGLDGTNAYLAAGKVAEARALSDELVSALAAVSRDGMDAAALAHLDALTEVASLNTGFISLAENKGDRAESAFRAQVVALKTNAGRNAARLGLGESLLQQSKYREAMLVLAAASALTYTSPDREARAQLGLGLAYRGLGQASDAKACLERVQRVYGATPAAALAAEALKTL